MDGISSVNRLQVFYRDCLVGTMASTTDHTRCTFQYDKTWLANGFALSPLELPLKSDLFIAEPTPFYGNFGVFEDSLPDGYGRYLLNRLLKKSGIDDFGLTPLQRLAIVGSSGMGALRYVPEMLQGEAKQLPELEALQQMALDVLGEKTIDGADTLYYNSGNSGGCRPKCILNDETGSWIVKFRHTYDPIDAGEQEYHYLQLAKACQIDIPECKLLQGKYLATKRFDLDAHGNPLHVVTAAGLLRESINPPKTDYKVLLALTGFMTQDPKAVEQMFRRMVFNVLIGNKDDHAKNFSFVYDEDKWRLAPAYDLTRCEQGYNGEHATSVMGKGNPQEEDLVAAGKTIRIAEQRAKEIIGEIQETVHPKGYKQNTICKQLF